MEAIENSYKLGIDIGSTTAKFVLLDKANNMLFSNYLRHNTKITETLDILLDSIQEKFGEIRLKVQFTGSAGMGFAERTKLSFIQEVIAAGEVVKNKFSEVRTLIDIGGEDSKMMFFEDGKAPDIRMNGSCAGGTGAFIDQMASLMNIPVEKFNELSKKSKKVYTIASRCGVFAKTDVQNMLARKIDPADIAKSVFHAMATQVINTLSRGYDVVPKVMLIGGPFTFLPELQKVFLELLHIQETDLIKTEVPAIMPAFGAALFINNHSGSIPISQLKDKINQTSNQSFTLNNRLKPLFKSKADFEVWNKQKIKTSVNRVLLEEYRGDKLFLGIDSGSTTSKIVVTGEHDELVFSYYANHQGNPIEAIKKGLRQFYADPLSNKFPIVYSAATGYGEDLIKASFDLNLGVVETIAHFRAAKHFNKNVSFVMDIGGQDMKAIFVDSGVVTRIELNESCSAGCGSFIESFGKTLGFGVAEFASMATTSKYPYDLGTRCTVFMNSKVKQALKENASIGDISAGLSISIIKNALYKVLKINDVAALGENIVVQGGAFKNPAVLKALEDHTQRQITISNIPELMGAFGAALVAKEHFLIGEETTNVK
jgi:predicted CoA-substrate-specific enzyme activase